MDFYKVFKKTICLRTGFPCAARKHEHGGLVAVYKEF